MYYDTVVVFGRPSFGTNKKWLCAGRVKYLRVPSVRIHGVIIMPGNLANLFLQSAKKEGVLRGEVGLFEMQKGLRRRGDHC